MKWCVKSYIDYIMLCYVTLRFVTFRYVTLTLRYVKLRYVTLCYVMLCDIRCDLASLMTIQTTVGKLHDEGGCVTSYVVYVMLR